MPKESKADRKKRAAKIIAILARKYPKVRTALKHRNPLELLVATILSAQCTDKRVNIVTRDLFKKYRTAKDYAEAPQDVFEQEIRSTGFYRNKAKSIRGAAAKIISDFGGEVPDNMDELLTLPGVARKTANVVLGDAFGKNEGVVVDTHVKRLAARLGLTRQKDPNKIENDLMPLVPRKDRTAFAHMLIYHGRETCTARKPNCPACIINKLCPSAFNP
ncbi:MAG: endonuclease III [Phycisphaerae bacterium]|nr:endonuclease III [Phycisphaerae bacterium]